MPDELADCRDDLIHRVVRFVTIHFALEPMPEPLNRIVLGAIWCEVLKFQPWRFGENSDAIDVGKR